MIKKRQLVIVEWDDIAGYKHWRNECDVKECCPTRCITIGWKMPSKQGILNIASTRTELKECVDIESIPRGCIKSIRRVND